MRTVAVVIVLGRHMTVCPAQTNLALHYVTVTWKRGGWCGVDLFFVLSGFLISGLLFREHQKFGRISFRRFFIRRGFKIYPAFYFMIVVTVIAGIAKGRSVSIPPLLHELLFVQNYTSALWNHTWSLAVEEHFYILLPAVLILSLRRRASEPFAWIPLGFAGLATFCLAMRIVTAALAPFNDRTHQFPTHLRIDSLFCGVFVGYLYHYRTDRLRNFAVRYGRYCLAIGIFCFVPAFVFSVEATPFLYTWGFSVLWAGGALVLLPLVFKEPRTIMPVRAAAFAGSRSYSIYLWHMPVSAWTIGAPMRFLFGGFNWYYYIVAYVLGSFAIGIAMASVVEYPLLLIRDKHFPSRIKPLNTSPEARA